MSWNLNAYWIDICLLVVVSVSRSVLKWRGTTGRYELHTETKYNMYIILFSQKEKTSWDLLFMGSLYVNNFSIIVDGESLNDIEVAAA